MAKNNVGSLYYEILLSPDGYKKGAAKIRKEDSDLSRYLTRSAKENLSEKEKIRADAERASKINWQRNADDPRKRAAISKLIIEDAKKRIKAVEALEAKARTDKLLADKRAQQKKEESIIDGMRKLISKQKSIDDKAREEKRKADARAAAAMPKTGMAGLFGKFQGIAGKIGTVTMAVWPLVQVFKTLGKVVGAVARVFKGVIDVIDEFRIHSIKMAKFMHGDMVAAKRLTEQVEQYAIKTSLSVDAGLEMAGSLLVLGVNADMVTARLRQFNSVALGDADKFKRVAKAYTDVLGAGILKRTELRQFTEAGVPIKKFLEDVLREEGRLESTLDEMISNKLVTAADVAKALDKVGKLYEGLDLAKLETVDGQIENITEEIQSWVRHSEEFKLIVDGIVTSLKSVGNATQTIMSMLEQMPSATLLLGAEMKKLELAAKSVEKAAKGYMAVMSLIQTGSFTTFRDKMEKDIADAEAEQDRLEAQQRNIDISLAASQEAYNKREEQAKSYLDARVELLNKEKTAQSDYDDWRKKHNVDTLNKMDQDLLNSLYVKEQSRKAEEASSSAKEARDKSIAERAASQLEAALKTALPQDAFKQNSVEEFRYMQDQRKQAERDAREQDRFDKKTQSDYENAKMVADAIGSIEYTNTADTAI